MDAARANTNAFHRRRSRKRRVLIAALLVLLALAAGAAALVLWAKSKTLDVYLINALDRPYSVRINGETVTLEADGLTQTPLPYGEITLEPADGSPGFEAQRVELSAWQHLGGGAFVVINPDRTAAIVSELVEYTDRARARLPGVNGPSNPFDIHVGRAMYTFEGVDYAFEHAPDQIELRSRTDGAMRRAVYWLRTLPPEQLLWWVSEKQHKDDALRYAKALLGAEPDNPEVLNATAELMGPEAFTAYAQPRLAQRPVLVDWHRAYQRLARRQDPKRSLYDEYHALWQADPTSGDLAYLVAAVDDEPGRSAAMMERAAPSNGYAMRAKAERLLRQGEFAAAVFCAERAGEMLGDPQAVRGVRHQALVNSGSYAPVIDDLRRKLDDEPDRVSLNLDIARLRAMAGDRRGAAQAGRAYTDAMTERHRASLLPPANHEKQTELFVEIALAEARGQWRTVIDKSYKSYDARWHYLARLLNGNVQRIDQALDKIADSASVPNERLLIFALAKRNDQPRIAERHLGAAIKALRATDHHGRKLAGLLAADSPPDIAHVLHHAAGIEQATVALVALAYKHPQSAGAYLAHARKLMATPLHPNLVIHVRLLP